MAERSRTPSIHVIETVAETGGIDPMELEPPLHQVIDTDALDALFSPPDRPSSRSLRVEFRYRGYDVVVEGPDDVRVRRSAQRPELDGDASDPTAVD